MDAKKLECPSCGAPLKYTKGDGDTITCQFCRTVVVAPEELRSARTADEESSFHIHTELEEFLISSSQEDESEEDLEEETEEETPPITTTNKSVPIRPFIIIAVFLLLLLGLIKCNSDLQRYGGWPSGEERSNAESTRIVRLFTTLTAEAKLTPKPSLTPIPRFAKGVITYDDTETGQGRLETARYITTDNNGTVYAAEREGGTVSRYDYDGKFLSKWTAGNSKKVILGIAANHDGKVFVAYDDMIGEYDGTTGGLSGSIKKSGKGKFGNLCVTADNRLLAMWYEINDSKDFEGDLVIIDKGSKITNAIPYFITGKMHNTTLPKVAITVDDSGTIYVLSNMVVYQYSLKGEHLGKFSVPSTLLDSSNIANTITVGAERHLYISNGKKIEAFTRIGDFIDTIQTDGNIDMITVDEQERIWGISKDYTFTITVDVRRK